VFSLTAYAWLIIGGLLEPAWIIALKKSDNFTDKKWTVATAILVVASPFCLSLAMKEVPVGTAYAVWTGIGAMGAIALGVFLYKESVERKRLFFIFLILVGSVGLALGGI
jgi:quaternary ammonium compound-resistance protein SugE